MVYFIFSPDDPRSLVKIGFTAGSVEERIRTLQTGNPFRLVLIMALDGGKAIEQSLHRRFRRLRVHGEWFRPGEELRAYIRAALGQSFEDELAAALDDEAKSADYAKMLGWDRGAVTEGLRLALAESR